MELLGYPAVYFLWKWREVTDEEQTTAALAA